MESNTSLCTVCSLRKIKQTSTYWCADCEETLCDECKEHHKRRKITRNHEPIQISEYKSVPSFITNIPLCCIHHNEKYQKYCCVHDVPICNKCIADHEQCDVTNIDQVIENAKSSEQFQDLEVRLVDLLKNIKKIKNEREANIVAIQFKDRKHVAEIKEVRKKMNERLDKLENDILMSLETKQKGCYSEINGIISVLNKNETWTELYQTLFENVKQNASNLQTFLGIKKFEARVLEKEQNLQTLMENQSFDHFEIVFCINTSVLNVFDNLQTFGSSEIKKTRSNICLNREEQKMNEIELSLPKTLSIDEGKKTCIRGCCMTPKGEFLFADHSSNCVHVLDSNGTRTSTIPLDSPFDLALIDEQNVAITSGHWTVVLLNLSNFKKKCFEFPGNSFGITHDGKSLLICVERYGICEMNTSDFSRSLGNKSTFSTNSLRTTNIAVFGDKIYYTNPFCNCVMSSDRNGSNTLLFFQDASILKEPTGITVDDVGNVYVVGKESSNLLVISKNGKYKKELLNKDNSLARPTAISFERQSKSLLIANDKGTAFLYDIYHRNA